MKTAGMQDVNSGYRFMPMRNLKIGTQLRIGFGIVFILVVILGAASWFYADSMWKETRDLYEHPLTVGSALGELKADIISMHMGMKDLLMSKDDAERQSIIQEIDTYEADARRQFNILYDRYLGPRTDIDKAYNYFVQWKSIRDGTIRIMRAGKGTEAAARTKTSGIGGAHVKALMDALGNVSDFAIKRGDKFYADAQLRTEHIFTSLAILLVAIFLLILGVSYIVLSNIQEPLKELTSAANQFRQGKLDSRSRYLSVNEYGTLSTAFNSLTETIQAEMQTKESVASIAGVMLKEEDLRAFCKALLKDLVAQTGSQIGAIYLLNSQKTDFEHFESIGLTAAGRASFSALWNEGELGVALATRQIQYIRDIPEDTRFSFSTVSGDIFPREILTIPVPADQGIGAVISLAGVHSYSAPSVRLVNEIWDVLTARLNGVLAIKKVSDLAEQLKKQNNELEAQKTELESQAAELTQQNVELAIQQKQLAEASRLKTNFLSNMSHELRTPLNSVIALSGVLNRRLADKIPEEEYSYLEVIERNGKHLLSLINDILDIARIESGREEIEITKFDVNNLVAEVVRMIHPQAKQKNIELLQTGSYSELFITGDAGKCRHILQNIIGNAVKFTDRGKVEVTTWQDDNNIKITVTDTGIGISEDHLPHIFDEFRQADGSTSRRFGGTGLGLAIAKKYADMLGGTVSVKSAPGNGSEFTLTLPLIYATEKRIGKSEMMKDSGYAIKQSPWKPVAEKPVKTILLVEDSEPAIIQIKDIMEESGYNVMVARDGVEALGIIAQTIPDAMILDLMMPVIDGFQVLKTLRETEQTARIPVLILTAKHITKEELKFLTQNNIHELIKKGDVNRGELLNAVVAMVFPETVETVKPQPELQTIAGKPVLLVVEDNPDNMLSIKALLADNYTVLEAEDGGKAVEMAKEHKPDLVLMDIALPDMDGIKSFKAIRKESGLQLIPIIALTASAMTGDRETILAHGFDAYIAKPIDEKLFFKTINSILYGK